jgi:hypothetical protein
MATTVQISRGSRVANGVRPWRIVIDGNIVGSVPPHTERVEVPVSPGHHVLRLESSKLARSRDLPFDVNEGQTVKFSCRSRPFGALVVPFSVIAAIKPDIWIILHPDNS